MPGAVVIAAHASAGRVEPTRLGFRGAEANPARRAEPEALVAEAPLAPGTAALGPLAVRVEIAARGELAQLECEIRNPGDRPVGVASLVLGFRWQRPCASPLRYLRHGWQSWSPTDARELDGRREGELPDGAWLRGVHHAVDSPPSDRHGWHESDLLTVVATTPVGPACLVGVLETGRAFGVVYARREGRAVALEVELLLDATLPPGASRRLETVRVALGGDANALLEAHAEEHGRAAGARNAASFLSGWCSWQHCLGSVAEADVLRGLEALVAGRDELPVDVVQIDDGYQRCVGDWLDTSPEFPRGLAPLAEEILAAGFVPGLWLAPFCVAPQSAAFSEHRDWLLQRSGEPFVGLLQPAWSADGSVFVLDTSREEVLDHLAELVGRMVALGFSYLKLDFLYTAALRAEAADASLSRAERLRRGLEALRSGAGEEAYLLGCGCPLGAAVGVVDAMRVGAEVTPRWLPDSGSVSGAERSQPSALDPLRSSLARAFLHRRLWVNDPDCLLLHRREAGLAPREVRALAAAAAATGGLTFVSDDVATLTRDERRLLREAVETAREVDRLGLPGRARALDLLAAEAPRGLVASDAGEGVVALVNAGASARATTLPAELTDASSVEPLLGSPPLAQLAAAGLEPRAGVLYRVRRAPKLAVFCDFDGTFSVQDVGATLAKRHAGARRRAAWERYERGEITAWQYNLEILDGLPLPLVELERFLQTIELDPGARDLVAWCATRSVPFRVLSDGFDYNLNRLQAIHRLRFAYDANRLRFTAGSWRIEAGAPDPACSCGTGVCKRARIEALRRRAPDATIVHIGNGRVSDLCGARAADVVFAKDSLAVELARRGERFEPFQTLKDVIPALESLLEG